MLPVAAVLGYRDEVGAVEYAGDAGHGEQFFGQRRAVGGFAARKLHGAAIEHEAAGDEFQGRGIGCRFSLNEHGFLRSRQFKADDLGACLTDSVAKSTIKGRKGAVRRPHEPYDNASISASLRSPGTSTTGIGNEPMVLAIAVTSGPGPSAPGFAANTSMVMSTSSLIT